MNNSNNIIEDLESGKGIDIIVEKKNFSVNSKNIEINENITSKMLLQQYKVVIAANSYILMKGEYGTLMRKIPKIYDDI